ncbi:TolC family protein [uncultured Alistipes sp.]|uniref:TolC family protein n=1 Tax=uncultured Alistipes sp. TaxID=538949 RepID=UPI00266DA4BE|nr:TolC family protein [uncultured Alistipes sp.]
MKRIALMLLAAASMTTLHGQTLDECRRLAREHYPEIRQYDLITLTEQYNLSNAARAWIPQVTLSGQASWQSDTPTFPGALGEILASRGLQMEGIRREQYRAAIDVSQTIWDGGHSRATKELAQAEAAEERQRTEVDLYALLSRVDDLYFGILLLDERLTQTTVQISLLESNLARMRSCVANGTATKSDADAIEAELLTVRQTLEQIEASRASYGRMLEIFIGQPLAAEGLERPAEPALGDVPLRPELALFEAQAQRIDVRRKALNSALMPRFSAFAQGYYGYPGLDMFQSMRSSDGTLNALVGVRMSWNIGALYTRRNDLGKLRTARQQIDIQRDIFHFNTRLQTTREEGEIARLRKAVASDTRIVELRRAVRVAAESQLENGVIDTTDLLRKITDETTAALNRSTHEIELLQTLYQLKHTLNQ